MSWIEPKVNWTSNDYYHHTDLNRVENNTAVIADLIAHYTTKPTLSYTTNRTMQTIEFSSSLNRIEHNINQLKNYYRPPNWVPTKLDWQSKDSFSFEDANRLERNLAMLYLFYFGNYSAIPNCGMATCGEALI